MIPADTLQSTLQEVRRASRRLALLTEVEINTILHRVADLALARQEDILAANAKDLARMDPANPKYDRLLLNPMRLQGIADDLRNVAALPSPLGTVQEERRLDNGLHLKRVSVPIGVIGIVFESRPNVTFDVFALTLKSGNACVLKGSRDAHDSNLAIVKVIHEVLADYGIEKACYLADSAREALQPILEAVNYIDCIIPRGSQGLINFVREHAKVPVIETGAGIVHTYFAASADRQKGQAIITNAKSRRVSVCNALDTLLIHESRLEDLPFLLAELGRTHECVVYADEAAHEALSGHYPEHLLHLARTEDFGTEFLSMKLSIKTVPDLESALDHIAEHSSMHSEAILTDDPQEAEAFQRQVDAAVVYVNTTTSFTDGAQFGLGAEIGISTQKLHARGPMALRELCSYKWLVTGDGQVRG